jgi:hypothetical protein
MPKPITKGGVIIGRRVIALKAFLPGVEVLVKRSANASPSSVVVIPTNMAR